MLAISLFSFAVDIPCSCGQTLHYSYDNLACQLTIRHGDGEAKNTWDYRELVDTDGQDPASVVVTEWILAVHAYEGKRCPPSNA